MSNVAIGSLIAYLLSLVVLIPGILGWGYLFGRAIGSNERETFTISEHGFLGILAYGVVALCINFFWPLTTWVALLVLITGYVLFISSKKLFLGDFRSRSEIAAFISLLAFMSLVRAHNSIEYDVGLYHLPAIVWGHESSIPLGLANLHSRFGFNSLWPVVSSVLWLPWFELKGVFSANAVITFFFFFGLLQWILRKETSAELAPSRLFALLTVLFLIFVGTRFVSAGSPSNDWPAGCLTLYAFFLGLRMSETAVDSQLFRRQWCLLCLISFLAIAIKISQLPVALLPMYFAIVYLKSNPRYWHREIAITMSVAAVASLFWLGRGVLLTGCLVYPWSASCVQTLSWAVPFDRIISLADIIKAFAREPSMHPSVVLADWSWLRDWADRFFFGYDNKIAYAYSNRLLTALFFVGMLTCIVAYFRGRLRLTESSEIKIWVLASLGVVIWFFTAPAERFGYGFLLPLALLPVVVGLKYIGLNKSVLMRTPSGAAYLLIAVVAVVSGIGFMIAWSDHRRQEYAQWPAIPSVPVAERINHEGQIIKVPTSANGKCWAIRPPCTPYFDPAVTIANDGRWIKFVIKQ